MSRAEPTIIKAPSGLQTVLADPALQTIFRLLNDGADSVRLVGGVVRNALMHRPVSDIDMATTHRPETVMDKALQAGLKVVPTGLSHGTVTVVIDKRSFEITTLREDIDTHGRHATVRFGRDFGHDAHRRDFTINALYADAEGRIYDYVGGLDDITRKQVRFIGDASVRITEDFLRILRFFRFSSDYAEGPIDPEGLAACIAYRQELNQLSRERVGSELIKILSSARAAQTLEVMQKGGILAEILPLPSDANAFGKLVRLAPEAGAMARLIALANPDQNGFLALRDALRLSNQQTTSLERTAKALALLSEADLSAHLGQAVFRFGLEAGLSAMMLAASRTGATHDELEVLCRLARSAPVASPFNGQQILARGQKPGPHIGAIMAEAERMWIEQGFSSDPADHERLVDMAVKHILH